MKTILIALILGFAGLAKAEPGEPKYPVSDIPEALKNNVNVVFREDKMVFTIHSESKASFYVHQVVTIFNEKGKKYAVEVIGYDKLSKIKDLSGTVYDALGKQIKRLKNNEIYDQSAFDGFSLYSDNRFKSIDLTQGTYPYTVEFEYEIEYKYLFSIPGFVLIPDEKIAVQNSSYQLRYPQNLEPRYKVSNTDAKPLQGKTSDGLQSLTWSFSNVLPIRFEPHGPPKQDLLVTISVAPTLFEYDHYSGTMSSWDLFGQWISSLNKGRGELPAATQQKVRELTKNLNTTEEKVKVVYAFLQDKTRYVSIQLGIGGYQPFAATVVDQTGYGDCKALSNYMVSMLNTIGIPSHYALIRAGEGAASMETDFPSAQFNHAIVAVPNGQDTLWLECTSQTNQIGYQGGYIRN